MVRPTVDPTSVGFTVLTQGANRTVKLGEAPFPARVTTKILLADPSAILARVEHVTVSHVYNTAMSRDPNLPPDVDPGEVIVPTEVVLAQSDGNTPVDVGLDDLVKISLVAEQMSPSVNRLAGTLLISGDSWDPISLPLTFTRGDQVTSVIEPDPLTIRQGGVGTATISARWVSGPYSDVTYHMVDDAESWGVTMEPDPASARILPGETKTITVTVRVERDALVRSRRIRIAQGGGGRGFLRMNLDVKPAPPPQPRQPDITQASAAIDAFYRRHRGPRGPFGFPLKGVELAGGVPSRRYAGGYIRLLGNTPQGTDVTWVRIRFVGFHCLAESDELSAADEPYFIIGVAGANNSNTVLFGPYEDVDAGESRFEATEVASSTHKITPPVVLGVIAMEHDEGTPEEAEAKVRTAIEAIEDKFDQAAGAFSGVQAGSHVMPEWARDIYIGWIPEVIAALFGLGDDEIGKMPMILFDNKADLEAWKAPKVIGSHGPNEYNTVLTVGSRDEGNYNLFFKVDLFRSTDIIQG